MRQKSIIIVLIAVLTGFCLWLLSPFDNSATDLHDREYFIAHGGGAIDGVLYTNSREAVLHSLARGYKYIEVDLRLTSDGHLVCVHEWPQFNAMVSDGRPLDSVSAHHVPTLAEFKSCRIMGRYTPMTAADLADLLRQYSFTLVTDKVSDVTILDRHFSPYRDRVFVEAFTKYDYRDLEKAGYQPMISLSSAQGLNWRNALVYFVYHPLFNGITYQRLVTGRVDPLPARVIKRLFGVSIAYYFSNSEEFFRDHLGKEIDMVYTDSWPLKNTKHETPVR